jgi:putative heme-binding domain-containing protein
LTDPVFVHHRLDAPAGDAKVAARIAALADSKSPRIFLEVFTALGRLRWPETPAWLHKTLKDPDRTLAHAAMQSLRRSDNWPAVLKLLELPDSAPIRPIALRAVADQAVPTLIDGIIALLQKEENAARRAAYADLLTRVYKKPPAWTYWGYRPPPRPPNSVLWERTDSIGRALDRVLADADRGARLAVLRRMLREKIPTKPDTLADWLAEELDDTRLAVIIEALREHPVQIARDPLKAVVTSQTKPVAARLLALTVIVANLDSTPDGWFPELLKSLEDGPVLEAALQHLPKRSWPGAAEFLFDKLTIARPAVRAAALEALAELRPTADQPQRHSAVFLKLMSDTDVRVRRAACQVAGSLQIRGTADRLLDLANDPEATVRQAALDSLRQLKDLRALKSAINALPEPITESAALQYIAELGGPDHSAIIARHAREHVSTGVLTMAIRALNAWSQNAPGRRAEVERSITELHGSSGVLMCWQVASPLTDEAAERWTRRVPEFTPTTKAIDGLTWNTVVGDGIEGRIRWSNPKPQSQWVAYADISVPEPMTVQFLTSGNMPAKVWLNGKLVFERDQRGAFQPDAERFDAELAKGVTRVCLRMSSGASTPLEFHLRFRRKSSRVEHEKLMQAALSRAGNAERGRKVFLDIQKSQCLKCHRLGDQGERIGPELTGVGSRFARVHLIESILEPSRTVVPGFQTHVIALSDGRVITGVKVAESDRSLTLADQQGKKIELQKSSIDRQQPSSTSTMPEGLEKPLTTDEFVDLIAFLVSQKNAR